MTQLSAADLEAAGWDIDAIDADYIQVLNRGRKQPFWWEGEGSELKIRFFARKVQSRYTNSNVYWLVDRSFGEEFAPPVTDAMDSGASFSSNSNLDLMDSIPSGAYLANLHIEENHLYAPQADGSDRWFWSTLFAPQSQEFEFRLSEVVSGPGILSVEVWASTQSPQTPDHHLRLVLNGQVIADEVWDGKGTRIIRAEIPRGLLVDGANQLQVETPGDTGVAADITMLNWITLDYSRRLVAQEGRLEFTGTGDKLVLTGLNGPVEGYDITDPASPDRIELKPGKGATLAFQSQLGHRYIVVDEEGYLRPVALLAPALSPDLRAGPRDGDYLAIGPADLLEPLRPLLEQRQRQGFQVEALPIEAIFDQFNYGLPEPDAIRNFLQYAAEKWAIKPRYVLLVGDSTYDPQGHLAESQANRLPAYLVDTVYGGETASDVNFARLDGDSRPDLALGRLPAQTPQQVETWVRKLLQYEQSAGIEAWNSKILAVADGRDPSFQGDAQAFLDRFPEGFQKSLLNPKAGAADTNIDIKRHIESGSLLVAYFGHGSVTTWGKDRLFSNEDVADLSNRGRYPLFVNMTCLTGLFTHPKVDSLAESLLWQVDGGAVAVLAPTSLTLPTDQNFLSTAFVDTLIASPESTIGEVLLESRRKIPDDSPGARDVMDTFLLFGDPAMVLR